MAKARPSFYILDSFSLIYQVFHAIPSMTGPAGQPTNAVFGIFRDVLNLVKKRRPDYLVAAFDGVGPVFRSEIFADYKANRGPMPDDLSPQIEVVRRVFEGFRIPVVLVPGFEADDVIATLARRAEGLGLDVFLCTSDKDARQLLGERIRLYNLRKDQEFGVEELRAEWGVRPDQVVDLLSLTGDTVDNVPGVPGIGPKTASKLLQEFGTLDGLLAGVETVKAAKARENLRLHAEAARRAVSLIKLREDVPIDVEWEMFGVRGPDLRLLKALCVECGFHRFLDELGADAEAEAAPDLWSYDGYELIDTEARLDDFVGRLRAQGRIAVDTETTSVDPHRADLVGIAFCWEAGRGAYLPVRGPLGSPVLDGPRLLDRLRPILEDPDVEKVGQNLKYDMQVLRRLGIELKGPITDTMVLSYLLESGERNHNLDELSRRFLDHAMIPIESLIGKGKAQKTMDLIEVRDVARYAAEDADAAWRLEALLGPRVREAGLWPLYSEVERPLIAILAEMERAGIRIDRPRLKKLSTEFSVELERVEGEIYALAGKAFNIGSGPQLRQVLFEDLGLPILGKTPGGEPSTAVEVLEELATKHELPRHLMRHRQLAKLKSTYLDTLGDLADEDERIHTSFHQAVAATGRLSSSDPNLQNIPTRTEEGRQIRQAFVAGHPGWSLLTADYSQIELRVLAHFSGDPALENAFAGDHDIHAAVASRIFGVPEDGVTKEQRRVAKTVNFGVIYGLSPFGLAGRLGISQADASRFIDAYFQEYAGVDRFITTTLESARDRGYVETILGRRRAINGIKNTTGRQRNLAERTAVNAVIQGSAADLIKKAMIEADRRIRAGGFAARMLLQIHDELVFEAPNEETPGLAALVDEAMTTALPLNVPIRVEIAAGPNWLDVSPMIVRGRIRDAASHHPEEPR